jgi:hypothetical protein
MAVKKAPTKKVVAKKSPTKKSSIKKKPQDSRIPRGDTSWMRIPGHDSEYIRKSGNPALADLIDRQNLEAKGKWVPARPKSPPKSPKAPMTKSTGKLSGRAMRGGKRMNAGKLDGM